MCNQEAKESTKNIDYFGLLPEGCIAEIVSHTTPVDACHLALVSPSFRSAAYSDPVWESFLPCDYRQLIARAVEDHPIHHLLSSSPSKKDVYLSLSDHPLLIDAGDMSFSLDKLTGKKCFMMGAKALAIVWGVGDTPMYWRWISDPGSRFGKSIELMNVCWFEIHGRISTSLLSRETAYTTYLVYKPAGLLYGFLPLQTSVGIIGEETIKSIVSLDPEGGLQHENADQVASPVNADRQHPRTRKDGWLEIELGEYYNKEGENRELEISLLELNANWKRGLIVQGIEIRPVSG